MTTSETRIAMTQRELIARARKLVPVLRDRAAEAEQRRQVPEESIQDLRAAGLLRIGNPELYGGYGPEGDFDAICEAGWELARGCGSTAWCHGVWSSHLWAMGHFPKAAQDEFFANGPDVMCSSSYSPNRVTMQPVSGGYRVSGNWSFSSGSDAGTWVMLGGPRDVAQQIWFLVPRSDYKVIDTWFVSGLRGTGSKDIEIEDAFVPSHRTIRPDLAGEGDFTGWDLHHRLSYRMPLQVMYGWELSAPAVGLAQGAADEFTARLSGTSGRGRTADSVALQLRLAEASAEVDAARMLQRGVMRTIFEKAEREETYSPLERLRYRRDKSYLVKLCVQATGLLFDASGGHALFDSQPIQRLWRDIQGVSHHIALQWDAAAEQYGRAALQPEAAAGGHP